MFFHLSKTIYVYLVARFDQRMIVHWIKMHKWQILPSVTTTYQCEDTLIHFQLCS